MPRSPTLDDLRRYAVARSLFKPTTLPRALQRMGFVQADPIRAPARAQDLTLRHRVADYCAGDLERRYARLPIEEDFFVNYGFVTCDIHALMHPRTPRTVWTRARWKQAYAVLDYVRERGVVHPRDVDAQFAHGKVTNWFGGSSNASTQLLDGMHYRGLVCIARREGGVRLYAAREPTRAPDDIDTALDQLIDVIVQLYAPLHGRTLSELVAHLRGGVPQWAARRPDALKRARTRLASTAIDGQLWYWPADENPRSTRYRIEERVRLLAPFDPVVWDRRRFEIFWGWAYRFEAYTPPAKRVRGYYALPLLWGDRVIGWANLQLRDERLQAELGYDASAGARGDAYSAALAQEMTALARFLGLNDDAWSLRAST